MERISPRIVVDRTHKVEPAKEEPAKEGEDAVGQSLIVLLFLPRMLQPFLIVKPNFARFDRNALLCSVLKHLWLSMLTLNISRPSQHLQRVKPRKERQRLRERERLLRKALLLRKVLLLQKARPLQLLQRKHPQRSREMCDSSLSVKGGEGEAAAPKSPHCCATSPFLGRVFVEIFLCVTLSPMSS